jgi:tetratricopeptide (TPR) repeat protein
MLELALLGLLFQTANPADEGMKALEAANYPAAIAAFQKAIAADVKDYAAHFHLGLAHSLNKDNASAEASYRTTLELKPGLYEAELNLGIVLLSAGQPGEAVKLLASAAARKPAVFRPVYYLAEAQLAAGDNAAAEKQFQAAAAIDAKQAPVHAGLGRALLRQGRLAEAEPALRKAAESDPAYRDGLLELAGEYEKKKQVAEAIAIYQGFADNVAVEERLGELYLESGRPAEAAQHLEKAVKASPSSANLYALATAYLRAKETAKAEAAMQQALTADPKNLTLALTYAGMLRDQRNFAAASRQYWRATQIDPTSKPGWMGLATMLLSLENYPQALAAFDKLEGLGEVEPGIHFLRALAFDKTKNYKPAMASYQKFLSLSQNKFPDEEFKARQRIKVIEKELSRR